MCTAAASVEESTTTAGSRPATCAKKSCGGDAAGGGTGHSAPPAGRSCSDSALDTCTLEMCACAGPRIRPRLAVPDPFPVTAFPLPPLPPHTPAPSFGLPPVARPAPVASPLSSRTSAAGREHQKQSSGTNATFARSTRARHQLR